MCLTIVEILMFIAGGWSLISGNVPTKLFKILFGKGEYVLSKTQTRLFGGLLISPFPLAILFGLLFVAIRGPEGQVFAIVAETLILIIVCILSVVYIRRFKQPVKETL